MPLPPLIRWPEVGVTLARTFGIRGAWLRAIHEVRKRGGLFRAAPRSALLGPVPPRTELGHVDVERFQKAAPRELALTRAERVVAGQYQAFSAEWRPLPATVVEWCRHPKTGADFPMLPWWTVPHLSAELGDIKQVWEPMRFAWAYDLVRGYLLTGDGRYAASFHRRLASWIESAPPFRGPGWACGQETAIRAVALLHAEAQLPATAEEAERITKVLAWSGERIADAIGYAISQRNNHSISESAGLIALGVRLRDVHPDAESWLETGRRILEREILAQFAPDGWYIQHSFNYLRVALDQCCVAETVLHAVGQGLSAPARARLHRAMALLTEVLGPSGDLPNHGPNDGASVLPRSLAPFEDHRPSLTLAATLFQFPLPADIPADREALAWVTGAPPVAAARSDGVARGEGWAVARRAGTIVFLRAGRYRSRPGHLDLLHLDVRGPGGPVVVDPGTYLYNALPPWNNGLVSALVHNGPVLDHREPGWRGPRFLWYLWPEGSVDRVTWEQGVATISGRSATGVQRQVRLGAEGITVHDSVAPQIALELTVRWTLHPDAPEGSIVVEGGSKSSVGIEGAVAGWFSPRYGERTSTRYIDASRPAWAGADLITRIRTER